MNLVYKEDGTNLEAPVGFGVLDDLRNVGLTGCNSAEFDKISFSLAGNNTGQCRLAASRWASQN